MKPKPYVAKSLASAQREVRALRKQTKRLLLELDAADAEARLMAIEAICDVSLNTEAHQVRQIRDRLRAVPQTRKQLLHQLNRAHDALGWTKP